MSNQFIDRKPPTPARALSSRHPLLMGQGLNLWCMETLCISTRHCLCVFAGAHTHINAWYTSIYLYMHECKYIYIRTCIYYISTRMCIIRLCIYICICMYVCMHVCMYVCLYVHMCIHVYIYCTYVYMYVCIIHMYVCMYVCMYVGI
jgi:hypothetical protein